MSWNEAEIRKGERNMSKWRGRGNEQRRMKKFSG